MKQNNQNRALTPFGEQVKIRLIELGMTQRELAQKIGCGDVYLNVILHGLRAGDKYIDSITKELGLDAQKATLEPIKTEHRPVSLASIEKGFLGQIKACLGISTDDYIVILQYVSKMLEKRIADNVKTSFADIIGLVAKAESAIKRNTKAV